MIEKADSQEKEEEMLEIVYYTDPLCCWSWAFEPHWQRLRSELGSQMRWHYCMGGLLPNWETFSDPMNAVSRPLQMGPLWYETKYISGVPINEGIWLNDPPSSSYPACIAVKCASLQSAEAEEAYLAVLREAVMLKEKNIARKEVLTEVAASLADGVLDVQRWQNDFDNGAGHQPFREDLQRVRYHKISRFPTLTITRKGGKGVMLVGYRPYPVLLEAIAAIAPEAMSKRKQMERDHPRYPEGK